MDCLLVLSCCLGVGEQWPASLAVAHRLGSCGCCGDVFRLFLPITTEGKLSFGILWKVSMFGLAAQDASELPLTC